MPAVDHGPAHLRRSSPLNAPTHTDLHPPGARRRLATARLVAGRALAVVALLAAAAPLAFAAGRTTPSATDVTRLPLGDGRVSASAKRGYVYACRQGPGRPGGAPHAGPWIHGSTFDLTEKAVVDGRVRWSGKVRFAVRTRRLVISGNGLPRSSPTGRFPIAPSDDAYAYDRNPNAIEPQTVSVSLPARPRVAATPSCVPMGMIGIAVNGVALFNALDDANRDAVAHETQDVCEGHPQMRGIYHYHSIPPCLTGTTVKGQEKLVGYALDGFPIFGPRSENGKLLTNAALDTCHGHVGWVTLRGKRVRIYHYHATLEYPYTLGCFRGTPVASPLAPGHP
jgi:YHYH protein